MARTVSGDSVPSCIASRISERLRRPHRMLTAWSERGEFVKLYKRVPKVFAYCTVFLLGLRKYSRRFVTSTVGWRSGLVSSVIDAARSVLAGQQSYLRG